VQRLREKGRGRAVRYAWLGSDAAIVAYMDIDLSTDLDALLPLIAPLVSGHSDIAIGSRLAPGARVARGFKRELISRTYNLLLHVVLAPGFATPSVASRPSAPTPPGGCCRRWSTRPGSSIRSCWSGRSAPGCGSTSSRSIGP